MSRADLLLLGHPLLRALLRLALDGHGLSVREIGSPRAAPSTPRSEASTTAVRRLPFWPGTDESPARWIDGHGDAGRELWDFARASAARWFDVGPRIGLPVLRTPAVRRLSAAGEQQSFRAAADLPGISLEEPGPTVHVDPGGCVDFGSPASAGAVPLRGGSAAPPLPGPALDLTEASDGVLVHLADGTTVHTEIVILGGASAARMLAPSLGGILVPVRTTWSLWRCGDPEENSIRIGDGGHAASWPGSAGTRWFEGCRWAAGPDLDAGDLPLDAPHPAVVAAQGPALRRLGHEPTERLILGADRVAVSCDGLPLVGPLPGRPRVHVLAGFGPMALGWLPGAVEGLRAGILGQPGARIPQLLDPRRFA